ncbi:hypothetical protein L596_022777 [Steinernema carpocapsae]|uniref:Uncharacterized protein n=1 Tax=Steinernema carpocapsae TaxID=34508 RepID=A0A4U5MNA0_STECR|nr:hypothetical protein L596_022777 [Steinernema carpocapsae]
MLAGNLLDLFRLMSIHRNPCGYMLPFWLTFLTRESYMFGVLGQTITFVTLSIERIYATLHRFHEFSGSRLFLALSTILIFIICFLFAFVYMGYDADWSAVTEMVTQNNEYNEKRIKVNFRTQSSKNQFSVLRLHHNCLRVLQPRALQCHIFPESQGQK